ncbi:MAG: hypothetical protein ACYTGJ_06525 [Planctomycetota bacterium]|jgi:hypothetical protein
MPTSDRLRRQAPWLFGLAASLVVLLALTADSGQAWRSPGGQGDMHDNRECGLCHEPAPGTLRQQVQANIQYWLGNRDTPAAIGTIPVTDTACLDCHRMPWDEHPINDFLDPSYAEERELFGPHTCAGCHDHHSGVNLTISGDYCRHCHEEIDEPDPPTRPTHQRLVADGRWETCLQCHDFHGSHLHDAPLDLTDAASVERVLRYLDGVEESPYGELREPYLEERGAPR